MTYVGYTVPLQLGRHQRLLRCSADVYGFVDRVGGFCLKVPTVCTTDKRYLHCTVYLLVRDQTPKHRASFVNFGILKITLGLELVFPCVPLSTLTLFLYCVTACT